MIIKRFDKTKGSLAISQIFILILGIVAISYALGSSIGFVSGETDCNSNWGPKNIDGKIKFCYGNSQVGFHLYTFIGTATSKAKIIDDRGIGYRPPKAEENGWQWWSNTRGKWVEVEGQTAFDKLADDAIKQSSALKASGLGDGEGENGGDKKREEVTYNTCPNACYLAGYDYSGSCKEACGPNEYDIVQQTDTRKEDHGCPNKCCCIEKQPEENINNDENSHTPGPVFNVKWLEEKEAEWQELDTPFKIEGGEITEIKTENGKTFVKTKKGKIIELSSDDIAKLQTEGYLDTEGNIIQDKIKAPPEKAEAPFGLDEKLGNFGYFAGHVAEGAIWAVGVWTTIQGIKAFLPEEYQAFADAASWALGAGVIIGKTVTGAIQTWKKGEAATSATGLGIYAGVVATLVLFVLIYKKETQETITFTCQPWDADTKGHDCDKCNKQGILPCSEYQCRSLGQSCELLNPGTDEEKCAWVNRHDVEFPRIETWEDALLSDNYKYKWLGSGEISPPDRGVRIEYSGEGAGSDKCIPAFTPLSFGIITSNEDEEKEPAKCKIDILRKDNFDDMDFDFGGSSLFKEEHKQVMSLPGSNALELENITIENDGNYSLYVRCQDANGNSNTAAFVFKFCVDKGPDETPPVIVTTDLINNMPFAYGQESININVYINEPAECKWSHSDQGYENMEHDMTCATSLSLMDAQGLFTCATILDGLKDGVKNRFYFRCQDKAGNVNKDSYEFVLFGTQPLVIDSVTPNETTVKDSTDPVKVTIEVKTSAGYKEGEATCYYKKGDEEEKDYKQFSETLSHQHSQDLWLPEDSYVYDIKCIDLGGNADSSSISFEVETDITPPVVVRAYHEDTYLKIVTNEKADCVYSVTECNYEFDSGLPMSSSDDGISHFIDWNTKLNFYIKCRDQYGKEPTPQNICSIIVRPFQIL